MERKISFSCSVLTYLHCKFSIKANCKTFIYAVPLSLCSTNLSTDMRCACIFFRRLDSVLMVNQIKQLSIECGIFFLPAVQFHFIKSLSLAVFLEFIFNRKSRLFTVPYFSVRS